MVDAIDIVPRVPPLKNTWWPDKWWGDPYKGLERLFGRKIIEYGHAGDARLAEKIIQVRACLCAVPIT